MNQSSNAQHNNIKWQDTSSTFSISVTNNDSKDIRVLSGHDILDYNKVGSNSTHTSATNTSRISVDPSQDVSSSNSSQTRSGHSNKGYDLETDLERQSEEISQASNVSSSSSSSSILGRISDYVTAKSPSLKQSSNLENAPKVPNSSPNPLSYKLREIDDNNLEVTTTAADLQLDERRDVVVTFKMNLKTKNKCEPETQTSSNEFIVGKSRSIMVGKDSKVKICKSVSMNKSGRKHKHAPPHTIHEYEIGDFSLKSDYSNGDKNHDQSQNSSQSNRENTDYSKQSGDMYNKPGEHSSGTKKSQRSSRHSSQDKINGFSRQSTDGNSDSFYPDGHGNNRTGQYPLERHLSKSNADDTFSERSKRNDPSIHSNPKFDTVNEHSRQTGLGKSISNDIANRSGHTNNDDHKVSDIYSPRNRQNECLTKLFLDSIENQVRAANCIVQNCKPCETDVNKTTNTNNPEVKRSREVSLTSCSQLILMKLLVSVLLVICFSLLVVIKHSYSGAENEAITKSDDGQTEEEINHVLYNNNLEKENPVKIESLRKNQVLRSIQEADQPEEDIQEHYSSYIKGNDEIGDFTSSISRSPNYNYGHENLEYHYQDNENSLQFSDEGDPYDQEYYYEGDQVRNDGQDYYKDIDQNDQYMYEYSQETGQYNTDDNSYLFENNESNDYISQGDQGEQGDSYLNRESNYESQDYNDKVEHCDSSDKETSGRSG